MGLLGYIDEVMSNTSTACAITWIIATLLPPAIIIIVSMNQKKNTGGPSWFWWGLGAYYLICIFLIPRLDFCTDPYWYLN